MKDNNIKSSFKKASLTKENINISNNTNFKENILKDKILYRIETNQEDGSNNIIINENNQLNSLYNTNNKKDLNNLTSNLNKSMQLSNNINENDIDIYELNVINNYLKDDICNIDCITNNNIYGCEDTEYKVYECYLCPGKLENICEYCFENCHKDHNSIYKGMPINEKTVSVNKQISSNNNICDCASNLHNFNRDLDNNYVFSKKSSINVVDNKCFLNDIISKVDPKYYFYNKLTENYVCIFCINNCYNISYRDINNMEGNNFLIENCYRHNIKKINNSFNDTSKITNNTSNIKLNIDKVNEGVLSNVIDNSSINNNKIKFKDFKIVPSNLLIEEPVCSCKYKDNHLSLNDNINNLSNMLNLNECYNHFNIYKILYQLFKFFNPINNSEIMISLSNTNNNITNIISNNEIITANNFLTQIFTKFFDSLANITKEDMTIHYNKNLEASQKLIKAIIKLYNNNDLGKRYIILNIAKYNNKISLAKLINLFEYFDDNLNNNIINTQSDEFNESLKTIASYLFYYRTLVYEPIYEGYELLNNNHNNSIVDNNDIKIQSMENNSRQKSIDELMYNSRNTFINNLKFLSNNITNIDNSSYFYNKESCFNKTESININNYYDENSSFLHRLLLSNYTSIFGNYMSDNLYNKLNKELHIDINQYLNTIDLLYKLIDKHYEHIKEETLIKLIEEYVKYLKNIFINYYCDIRKDNFLEKLNFLFVNLLKVVSTVKSNKNFITNIIPSLEYICYNALLYKNDYVSYYKLISNLLNIKAINKKFEFNFDYQSQLNHNNHLNQINVYDDSNQYKNKKELKLNKVRIHLKLNYIYLI